MKKVILGLLLASSANAAIIYAPEQKPKTGDPLVTCVGLKFPNSKRPVSAAKCRADANQNADFYKQASRGLFKTKTKGDQMVLEVPGNKANYNKAVQKVKATYKSDYWAVISQFTHSHAGGRVANLKGTLYRDFQHEFGHLLGLGHSGRYVLEKGKWVLEAYGDSLSVMGRFPSGGLVSSQYYALGWLKKEEVAVYDPGQIYELRQLIPSLAGEGLVAVMVKPDQMKTQERKAFISYVPCKWNKAQTGCIALHLATGDGGGTQRVMLFVNEYYDQRFTGLHIKRLETLKNKIKLSIDFNPMPATFKQEVEGK